MADFLSIKDAARRLGVKPKEIRRRIKDGELDGFVRLPGGSTSEPAAFGPAAPNRRAAPPPEQDAHVQRLEETVLVLQSELNARREEVEELHVLLREIKDSLVAAPTAPAAAATPAVPTAAVEPASPAEPEIDWGAYDAESEQLRATMGRLEALLEQLEEPEPESEPEPEPVLEAVSKPEPAPASASEPLTAPAAPAPTAAPEAPVAAEAAEAPEALATVRPKPASKPTVAPIAAASDDAPTAEALSRRREKMGVSREALAAFARISWGFVTEVESGRRKDPRGRQRLAAALDAWQKRLADERRKAAS